MQSNPAIRTKHVSAFKLMEGKELTKVQPGCSSGHISGMRLLFFNILFYFCLAWSSRTNTPKRVQMKRNHSTAWSFPVILTNEYKMAHFVQERMCQHPTNYCMCSINDLATWRGGKMFSKEIFLKHIWIHLKSCLQIWEIIKRLNSFII